MRSLAAMPWLATLVVLLYPFLSDLVVINYLWGVFGAAALIFLASNFQVGLAAAAGGLAAVALLLLGSLPDMVSYLFSICLPALVIGISVRNRRGAFRAIFLGLFPALVLIAFFVAAYAEISTSLLVTLESWMEEFALQASRMGESPEMAAKLTSDLKGFGGILVELFPSLVLLSILFNLTVAYFLSHRLGSRLGCHTPGLPSFSRWRLSDYFLGVVLLGAILSLLAPPTSKIVGHNLLAASAGLYFFVGFSVIESFLLRLNTPKLLKVIFYILIFLGQMISLVVLAVLGLFDSWFDFRKLKSEVAFPT